MPERIVVIGMDGDHPPSLPARRRLGTADLVVGTRRHLDIVTPPRARVVVLGADIDAALDAVAAEPGQVCVLASGDPGFFGILRPLAARFPSRRLEVHPAVSSVSATFARLGIPWDDAVVVSAHGRPLERAVAVAARSGKVAVLVSPDNTPEALGRALLAAGVGHRLVHVCSHLGSGDESVTATDVAGLARGTWDPMSVVVLLDDHPVADHPSLAWGIQGDSPCDGGAAGRAAAAWGLDEEGTSVPCQSGPASVPCQSGPASVPCQSGPANPRAVALGLDEEHFEHRSGMITKSEVRAVALGKLALAPHGTLWDVGAGSASVAIEAARLAPALKVYAVERDPDDAMRARRNVAAHRVPVQVVEGPALAVLPGLPDPDRVFVGGGGLDVLDAALERLRPDGRVVATYAALDRAVAATSRLGNLVQLHVARGERLADGGLRLAARNPVFIVWGPGR